MFEKDTLKEALIRLIFWLPHNGRDLPWRLSRDPYQIWVSEIMLQQTRTTAVIPYYERFITELPNVRALAEAPDDTLMKLWEGLGYYSRARNLKKAAQIIVREYDGRLPANYDKIRSLPGIGDYTAGAICSIAFEMPEPAVDGNVLRVIMRLLASDEDISKESTKKRVIAMLRELYPNGGHSIALTEALMQLGENVCIPNGEARCELCPLSDICAAKLGGIVSLLPVKSPKKPRKTEFKTVLILRHGQKIAVLRRPEKGLLAGLYELPNYSGDMGYIPEYLAKHGMTAVTSKPLGKAKHIFTHIEWWMEGADVEVDTPSPDYIWITPEEAKDVYAIPMAFRYYTEKI
ncbi:MAG: A/G-specific adenine glycosylase [Clostridia bacterium]|nr:A/G-specific adenine glycosylase [Clostridia bacterium]